MNTAYHELMLDNDHSSSRMLRQIVSVRTSHVEVDQLLLLVLLSLLHYLYDVMATVVLFHLVPPPELAFDEMAS